jgi:hypothetical protein
VAFPQVIASNTSFENTNVTNHDVALPNGCNVVGRRIVAGVGVDSTASVTVTWPAGWTEISQALCNAGNGKLSVAYHDTDGTEGYTGAGDTIVVVLSFADGGAHISYLITGFDPATAPEGLNNNQLSTGTNVDPPSLTPAGGAKDYLWMAWGDADALPVVTAYPTNYTDNQLSLNTGVVGGQLIMAATRELNAATEDPGAFTIDAAHQRCGITVAISPVVAGGSSQPPRTMHQHRTRRAA